MQKWQVALFACPENSPTMSAHAPKEPTHWTDLPNAPAPGTILTSLEALADGQVLMVEVDSAPTEPLVKPFLALVLRSGDQITAFANRCAHFGVPLAAQQSQLIFHPHTHITCNVHYARYRWSDGVCDRGDCEGERLLPIPVDVDSLDNVRIAHTAATHTPALHPTPSVPHR